tara:strand:+ start:391 stop:615 length:225 start_codon:yes stop_codon:yes gene_type:complete
MKYDQEIMQTMREHNGRRFPGTYQFDYEQRKVFYDLHTDYKWDRFKIEYMKRLICFQKYSTINAFKKVVLERKK